jgi:hypothetical protein
MTPETPRDLNATPMKPPAPANPYISPAFSLKPANQLPRAVISGIFSLFIIFVHTYRIFSGDGIWGEHFRFELHQYPTGFLIGRKNPNVDLDMSEYTDVRTVSHRHCMFVFNRKLNQFQIGTFLPPFLRNRSDSNSLYKRTTVATALA